MNGLLKWVSLNCDQIKYNFYKCFRDTSRCASQLFYSWWSIGLRVIAQRCLQRCNAFQSVFQLKIDAYGAHATKLYDTFVLKSEFNATTETKNLVLYQPHNSIEWNKNNKQNKSSLINNVFEYAYIKWEKVQLDCLTSFAFVISLERASWLNGDANNQCKEFSMANDLLAMSLIVGRAVMQRKTALIAQNYARWTWKMPLYTSTTLEI